jgi:alkanesulfonate monooxygenase SsuD/methylene tetrahydromethanopterin reductase-like flavin-dependent oxidoreductase (luciferase family)
MKIGLMVKTANDRATNSARPYQADESTQGIWECWTVLAALAEATQRVELGTLVLCNTFRNPAILAKMATALDEVSQGRLILGIGAGWNEPEHRAFGLPFDHLASRFDEAMQILRPLLRDGHVDFAGQYYQALDCDDVPRGPRAAGPPLLLGGEGPRMLRLAARYADLWNTGYTGQPETIGEPMSRIEAACREVGRDPRTLGVTALIGLWFPDLRPDKPVFLDNPLIGTPEEIATAMRGYASLGVQHIMFQCEPQTAESLTHLTKAVQLYRGTYQPAG